MARLRCIHERLRQAAVAAEAEEAGVQSAQAAGEHHGGRLKIDWGGYGGHSLLVGLLTPEMRAMRAGVSVR